jgi:hypothetical protein
MYLLVQALKIRGKRNYIFMLDIERKVAKEKVINRFTIKHKCRAKHIWYQPYE